MRLHKDVKRLMKTHGYDVTFKRVEFGGNYDPATGLVSGGSTLTWTGRGVFTDFTGEEVNGTSILADDRKLLLQADELEREPAVGDQIDDSVQVVDVRKLRSGQTTIAYTLQTRG